MLNQIYIVSGLMDISEGNKDLPDGSVTFPPQLCPKIVYT